MKWWDVLPASRSPAPRRGTDGDGFLIALERRVVQGFDAMTRPPTAKRAQILFVVFTLSSKRKFEPHGIK